MLVLITIPFLIAAVAFVLDKKITWKEFLVQVAVQLVVIGLYGVCIYEYRLADTEILNGTVAKKWTETVHCRHGYPCNCHEVCSGSGKNKSCYTHCDTCYVHLYDRDWDLTSTTGREWSIDTIDSQGLQEPPRWSKVVVGEGTAETHSYTNYVLASPDSLFRLQGVDLKPYESTIPTYPSQVYDYYRLNRFLPVDTAFPDVDQWNTQLSLLNGRLGPIKQANVVIVVVKGMYRDYFNALRVKWVGGKKNDIVIVFGTNDQHQIVWDDIMAWTDKQDFIVVLKDDLMKVGVLDRQKVLETIEKDVPLFVRKPMSDYSYLRYLLKPTEVELVIGLIIGILLAVGLAYWMDQEDLFGDQGYNRYRWN